jgi:hypothetical protein
MTQKTFTLRSAYILSGIKKDGSRVYYDTDDHSGGYPYWSTYCSTRKEFPTLDKVPTIGAKDYMRNDVIAIEVLEVTHRAKIISSTELVSDAKAKAMAEIEKIQKELAKKIAKLEGM